MFGWTECETLAEGYAELFPSLECNKVFRIDTGTDGDYFLLENRRQAGFDSALPGSGLIIYHILPQIEERAADNRINAAILKPAIRFVQGVKSLSPIEIRHPMAG